LFQENKGAGKPTGFEAILLNLQRNTYILKPAKREIEFSGVIHKLNLTEKNS